LTFTIFQNGAKLRVKSVEIPPWSLRAQSLSLLKQDLLIAAERNSDDVSTMMNQPVVPPSKT